MNKLIGKFKAFIIKYRFIYLCLRCFLLPTVKGPWPIIPLSLHLLCAKVWYTFLINRQYFGDIIFYQSCEDLLLPGIRPTKDRFERYNLQGILRKTNIVLDIGCNVGFFSLFSAKYVAHLDAFDSNSDLIQIGELARKYLNLDNVNLFCQDFKDYNPQKKYDVIYCFAVHKWIGMPIEQFAHKLRQLSNNGTIILFESNNLTKLNDFDDEIAILRNMGFRLLSVGETNFDCPRKHVYLQKITNNCENRD